MAAQPNSAAARPTHVPSPTWTKGRSTWSGWPAGRGIAADSDLPGSVGLWGRRCRCPETGRARTRQVACGAAGRDREGPDTSRFRVRLGAARVPGGRYRWRWHRSGESSSQSRTRLGDPAHLRRTWVGIAIVVASIAPPAMGPDRAQGVALAGLLIALVLRRIMRPWSLGRVLRVAMR